MPTLQNLHLPVNPDRILSGDWVAVCSECGAKNILAVIEINNLPAPTLKMIGWNE